MRYSILAVLVGYFFHCAVRGAQGQECSIPDEEKLDCAFKGMSRRQCLERGCCWVLCPDCDERVPWCFHADKSETEDCAFPSEEKEDCGYYGIMKGECLDRGCCWKPSKHTNDPWCFKAKQVPSTTTTTTTTRRTTETATTPPITTKEPRFEGEVRLTGGITCPAGLMLSGRVEVYHDGQWGTVCDDNFDDNDARVICRQLSLFGGLSFTDAHFGKGDWKCPIWLDDMMCDGGEESLSLCDHNGWGMEDCNHLEDASVQCDLTPTTPSSTTTAKPIPTECGYEGQVRLVQDDAVSAAARPGGRLEIHHDGQWGTVCDNIFSNESAEVVCRQLSMYGGIGIRGAYFGEGNGPIWMDNVNCVGDESTLSECHHMGWGVEDCEHDQDVSVECDLYPWKEGQVRLMDGDTNNEGRVEIFHDGEWGTICDDEFTDANAEVVCRQLSLSGGTVFESAELGIKGRLWLDKMDQVE